MLFYFLDIDKNFLSCITFYVWKKRGSEEKILVEKKKEDLRGDKEYEEEDVEERTEERSRSAAIFLLSILHFALFLIYQVTSHFKSFAF